MKKLLTLNLMTFCLFFTGWAQLQLGSSINGAVVEGGLGKSVSLSSDGSRLSTAEPNNGTYGVVNYYNYDMDSWNLMALDNSTLISVGNICRLSGNGMFAADPLIALLQL